MKVVLVGGPYAGSIRDVSLTSDGVPPETIWFHPPLFQAPDLHDALVGGEITAETYHLRKVPNSQQQPDSEQDTHRQWHYEYHHQGR